MLASIIKAIQSILWTNTKEFTVRVVVLKNSIIRDEYSPQHKLDYGKRRHGVELRQKMVEGAYTATALSHCRGCNFYDGVYGGTQCLDYKFEVFDGKTKHIYVQLQRNGGLVVTSVGEKNILEWLDSGS